MRAAGIDSIESPCVLAGEVIVLELCGGDMSSEAAAGDGQAKSTVGGGVWDGDEERLQWRAAVVADGERDGVGGERWTERVAMAGENSRIGADERRERKKYK